MPNIKIDIKNKIATGDGTVIIGYNKDYVIDFTFDEEWSEYVTKTMIVRYGCGLYQEVVFVGDSVTMPMIADQTEVFIGVYAGDLRTSSPAHFYCISSIKDGLGTHDDPPDDVYTQILALIQAGVLKGKSAYEYAVEHGYNGTEEQFGEDVKTSASSSQIAIAKAAEAAQSAVNAAQSAQNAETSEANANAAKIAAETAKAGAEAAKTAAETAKAGAETAKTAAETAKNTAISAKDAAISASSTATNAKNDAVTAKTDAQTAATEANTYKTAAEAAAERAQSLDLPISIVDGKLCITYEEVIDNE